MWSTELVFEREAAAEHDRAFAHVTRFFMRFVLCAASVAPVCASLTSLLARAFGRGGALRGRPNRSRYGRRCLARHGREGARAARWRWLPDSADHHLRRRSVSSGSKLTDTVSPTGSVTTSTARRLGGTCARAGQRAPARIFSQRQHLQRVDLSRSPRCPPMTAICAKQGPESTLTGHTRIAAVDVATG
jgi:hypothetical protein